MYLSKLSLSIIFFIIIFFLINYSKPAFLFNKDGSYKQFGLGLRTRSVIPIWLVAIIVAILCYIIVKQL
jgi:hypothetical protein